MMPRRRSAETQGLDAAETQGLETLSDRIVVDIAISSCHGRRTAWWMVCSSTLSTGRSAADALAFEKSVAPAWSTRARSQQRGARA